MDKTPAGTMLRDNLCGTFCSFYKPLKQEETTCLGYQAVAWLLESGRAVTFVRRDELRSSASAALLSADLCPACPFYRDDCDYAAGKEKAPPCGGFLLLSQLLCSGAVSIDDIRKFGLNLRRKMKIYELAGMAREKGEYILGSEALQTHACYLGFGILAPGDRDREIRPGTGHEEICCVVSGAVTVTADGHSAVVGPGQAFYLKGEQCWLMSNEGPAEAVYVLAGGHSAHHAHH